LDTNVVQEQAGFLNHARKMVESVQPKISQLAVGIFGRMVDATFASNSGEGAQFSQGQLVVLL